MSADKANDTPRPLPRGEVMATGIVGGVRVEIVRYTEDDIHQRDREWQHEVERERSIATQFRCRMMNLELDLQRLLERDVERFSNRGRNQTSPHCTQLAEKIVAHAKELR